VPDDSQAHTIFSFPGPEEADGREEKQGFEKHRVHCRTLGGTKGKANSPTNCPITQR